MAASGAGSRQLAKVGVKRILARNRVASRPHTQRNRRWLSMTSQVLTLTTASCRISGLKARPFHARDHLDLPDEQTFCANGALGDKIG